MKRVRVALIALFVAVSTTAACDSNYVTGASRACGNGPTMGSGC